MKTVAAVASAAGAISFAAASTSIKVHGHSGQFSLIRSDEDGNATSAKIRLAGVRELDAAGNTVGVSGSTKHSLNTFANQDFSYTTPERFVQCKFFFIPHLPLMLLGMLNYHAFALIFTVALLVFYSRFQRNRCQLLQRFSSTHCI